MLVLFAGPPCSGKTTTAARLFADLKDFGYATEFLPEQARFHIAREKFYNPEFSAVSPSLQHSIMDSQYLWELRLSKQKSLVITDTCVLNGLLYLPDTFIGPNELEKVRWETENATVVFRCPPVQPSVMQDPNRVHTYEEAVRLDGKLTEWLERFDVRTVLLNGDTMFRAQQAMSTVMDALL